MWTKIAHFILKNRLLFILTTATITVFMGYMARRVELTYDYAAVVPADDPDLVYFKEFKQTFGEDANILAIGLQDSGIYSLENFNRLKWFSDEISKLQGVSNVLSLPRLQYLAKDTANRRLVPKAIFAELPNTQAELDSQLRFVNSLQFYKDQVINSRNGATVILVSIDKKVLNSPKRTQLTNDIVHMGEEFTKYTKVKLHYAGVPFVRSVLSAKVKDELRFFLILSAIITTITLYVFFKAFDAVIISMLVIGVVVVWAMGTMGIFHYKITLLTGLLPAIVIVMTVPNCIYLLNKYHQEFEKSKNKMQALSRTIAKLGMASFLINATTAAGFLGLMFTDVSILEEFGIVAGINVFVAFFICLLLIPAIFSYLPAPTPKKLQYLYSTPVNNTLIWINGIITKHPRIIYGITIVAVLLSCWGIYNVKSVTYMVDDIPEESDLKKDLAFFERNFQGIMPLEIIVDTKDKRGLLKLNNLQKIEEFESTLAGQPTITRPVSVVEFVKAARQAFYNNNPDFYGLPTNQDKNFILLYLKNLASNRNSADTTNMGAKLIHSFVDSTGQRIRISLKVADLGSYRMDTLLSNVIYPAIEKSFGDTQFEAKVTGTTVMFSKGNTYLKDSLTSSLVTAFIVIVLMIAALFMNLRMVLISLAPNVVALLVTGGLMGVFDISLKPSTSLIFSISFGIVVDSSIHYLARYRQELLYAKLPVPQAVYITLMETGQSIIYTSLVLFVGFVIFAWSDFGGTIALGVLMSVSMLIAMVTNLTLLPALLNSFDPGKVKRGDQGLIEEFDDFYLESEDEEIDIKQLDVKK
jgi:hypothetical protein